MNKDIKSKQVELETICEILRGSGLKKSDIVKNGKNKCILYGQLYTTYSQVIYKIKSKTNKAGTKISVKGDVLLPATTITDAIGIVTASALMLDNVIIGSDINIFRIFKKKINPIYLANLLSNNPYKKILASYAKGTNIIHLYGKDISKIKIPLPPLNVQKKIVKKIKRKQRIIDIAYKKIKKNEGKKYSFDKKLRMQKTIKKVPLGEICDIQDSTYNNITYTKKGYPLITPKNIKNGKIDFSAATYISKNDFDKINKKSKVNNGDIIIPMTGITKNPIIIQSHREFAIKNIILITFKNNDKINNTYIKNILMSTLFNSYIRNINKGKIKKTISLKDIRNFTIPFPPLIIQKKCVVTIEKREKIIRKNKELITIMKKNIEKIISEI